MSPASRQDLGQIELVSLAPSFYKTPYVQIALVLAQVGNMVERILQQQLAFKVHV